MAEKRLSTMLIHLLEQMGLVTYTLAPRCLLVAYKSALTPMSTFTTARRDTSGSVTRYKAFLLRISVVQVFLI